MGLFSKDDAGSKPIFETKYLGSWIAVFRDRVEFKMLTGGQSIPINQIASVELGTFGLYQIILETAGGKRFKIPTSKKKEVKAAIQQAQSQIGNTQSAASAADEITKLHALKEKGVLTQEEFEAQKARLLG